MSWIQEFHSREGTLECMKIKLFLEPKGKAREEIALQSSVPTGKDLFLQWKSAWIPKKDFQEILKHTSPSPILGELREGKIIQVSSEDIGGQSLKGKLYAYRSFVPDGVGGKKKLPMVLFGRVKSNFKIIDFMSKSEIPEKQLKSELKQDPWAPISTWHAPPLKRSEEIPLAELIDGVSKYSYTLSQSGNQTEIWTSILETEIYRS